jgi:hypothetical protein
MDKKCLIRDFDRTFYVLTTMIDLTDIPELMGKKSITNPWAIRISEAGVHGDLVSWILNSQRPYRPEEVNQELTGSHTHASGTVVVSISIILADKVKWTKLCDHLRNSCWRSECNIGIAINNDISNMRLQCLDDDILLHQHGIDPFVSMILARLANLRNVMNIQIRIVWKSRKKVLIE